MDKIRVSKVENVTLCKRGDRVPGTLHLAQHHLIFSYMMPSRPDAPQAGKARTKELWVTYPMIAYCTYQPMPPASRKLSTIRLKCRDFTFSAFLFEDETQGRKAYETIKSLACGLGRIDKLYAFIYQPPAAEKKLEVNGWNIYDARAEFKRMGISPKDVDKGWRLTDINHDYAYSPTYPSLLAVPSSISDNVLKYGGSYRSRVRIPALTYLHPVNSCSITRSAQPLVGIFQGKRNPQDERLVEAIFRSSTPNGGTSTSVPAPEVEAPVIDVQAANDAELSVSETSSYVGEDDEAALQQTRSDSDLAAVRNVIYGAQKSNLIVDARPQINAMANQATGMGSENMEYYKDATKAFLGIANIHVMRDSLNKVIEAFSSTDITPFPPNQEMLAKSRWLEYISLVLRGADLVARQVGINHSHVLIHCSDGWDRTSQISALSQLCLDPYYRTLEGFIVLIEKDWLSFGHMFRHRSGFLGSDKWFEIENERIAGGNRGSTDGSAPGVSSFGNNGNALENAFFTAKGFFTKQKNDSRESLGVESEDNLPASTRATPSAKNKHITKVKETSPIFHQFLDATYQLLYQHPTRFEFNERFLRRLLYHLYSCQYGTFLFDSERERVESRAKERTRSVWDYFLSRRPDWINSSYVPEVDDKTPGRERLLFPDTRRVRWWPELYGRTDEEMNGRPDAPTLSVLKKPDEPVVTGLEHEDVAVSVTASNGHAGANGVARTGSGRHSRSQSQNNPLQAGADRLSAGLASLTGLGVRHTQSQQPIGRSSTPPVSSKARDSLGEMAMSENIKQDASPELEGTSDALPGAGIALPGPYRREDMFSAFARENAFRDS